MPTFDASSTSAELSGTRQEPTRTKRNRKLDEKTTELDEALARQTATAEVLQVINSSLGDLAPVFDAILEKAHSLCGAPLGSLVLCDGEQLRAVATRGYPQEYDALARQGFPPTPPFRLLLSGAPLVDVELLHDPAWSDEDDWTRRAAVEIAGIRTAVFVPLRRDATVLGYISAQRQEAAWREMVGEGGIDVAVPEQVAEPEADREIEHDIEVGARLTARRDDGRPKLHQLAGILIKREADPQPLPLPGAGDWQYDIGKGGGRRQVEVGLDMEFEGAQRLPATRCVGVRQQQIGAKPNEAPHAVRLGV